MGSHAGHIELERSIDSIVVGNRHRTDLGDIDALAASIAREGLLQPPTVTPEGVLVCGARRLAALRKLGWKQLNVWVRSGISDRLGQLMAEQDDNVLHKPLSQTEAATLYRELKDLIAEDAARRQEATRFTPEQGNPRSHGAATVAAPSAGDTRKQAALLVTGRNSYTSLERIHELQRVADDPAQPESVRERARAELAGINEGASITAAHERTRTALSLGELDRLAEDASQPGGVREAAASGAARVRSLKDDARAADLERLAAEALARAKSATKRRTSRARQHWGDGEPVRHTLRAFVLTWDDLDGWWTHFDPTEVGAALTDDQWARFEATVGATVDFLDIARTTRFGHPRATA